MNISTSYKEPDNNHIKSEENNEHKISEKRISMSRNVDHNKDHDSVIRTRYKESYENQIDWHTGIHII